MPKGLRDNSMLIKHIGSETREEPDMRSPGIIWLKLNCLNPILLALNVRGYEYWLKRIESC